MSHRNNPIIAKKGPYVVELEEGKTYFWCSCGHSEKQPFCDGSHTVTDLKPIKYVAKESKRHGLCGCKHTKNAPLCDREHRNLD